jgi:hypothetical protein
MTLFKTLDKYIQNGGSSQPWYGSVEGWPFRETTHVIEINPEENYVVLSDQKGRYNAKIRMILDGNAIASLQQKKPQELYIWGYVYPTNSGTFMLLPEINSDGKWLVEIKK